MAQPDADVDGHGPLGQHDLERPAAEAQERRRLLLHTPHAWLLHMIRNSANSDTRLALFRTCSVLKQFVLQASAHTKLTINLGWDGPMLLKAIQAASGDLATRGAQSTELVMEQQFLNMQAAFLAMCMLSSPNVTQFTTRGMLRAFPFSHCQAFLSTASTALPNLTTLNLDLLSNILPPPSQLPHLTNLTFTLHEAVNLSAIALGSVAPYLLQLIRLTVNHSQDRSSHGNWHDLFTQPSTTLTHFSTDQCLTEDLVPLLVRYTPALTHVSVSTTLLLHQSFATESWRVTSLTIEHGDCLFKWAHLPQSPGVLDVYLKQLDTVYTDYYLQQGIPAEEASRYSQWRVHNCKEVRLGSREEEAQGDPASLTTALQQLTALQLVYDGWRVGLQNVDWTPATARALKAAVAAHPQMTLRVRPDTLTDDALDALLQHGPEQGYQMAVHDIELQSEAHRSKPWPWQLFRICEWLSARTLVNLPDPEGEVRKVQFKNDVYNGGQGWLVFDLNKEEVDSGLVDQLTRKLQSLEFSGDGGRVDFNIEPGDITPEAQAQALKANLGLLHHVKVSKESKVSVYLCDWTLDEQAIAELSGLPQWNATLQLRSLQWAAAEATGVSDQPAPPAELVEVLLGRMAAQVPSSFHTWQLIAEDFNVQDVAVLCRALMQHRPEGLPPVKVVVEYCKGGEDRLAEVKAWVWMMGLDSGKVVVEYEGYEEDEEGAQGEGEEPPLVFAM